MELGRVTPYAPVIQHNPSAVEDCPRCHKLIISSPKEQEGGRGGLFGRKLARRDYGVAGALALGVLYWVNGVGGSIAGLYCGWA